MATKIERRYLSVKEIQKEYLPISVKKIREFVKKNTTVTTIGGRMYVPREQFENALSSCSCDNNRKEQGNV